ncbi:MAG: hypothetical protein IKD29_08240 [Lentisphaeria bacterium]|nr:hypothetical protein [Lentisphaeria bacterium]
MKKHLFTIFAMCTAVLVAVTGCSTKTAYISDDGMVNGEEAQAVAGFSEKDIQTTVRKALKSILELNSIVPLPGTTRAVVTIKSTIDTTSRGKDATVLAEALEMEFAQQLTDSGKILVYNQQAAQYAQTDIKIQYLFQIRLTERILRQDDDDAQKEYNLNLQLVDLVTGLTFWQRRVPLRKLVDADNIMN